MSSFSVLFTKSPCVASQKVLTLMKNVDSAVVSRTPLFGVERSLGRGQ